MTSERKIAANRRNAQRSTGPRSGPGKDRVRRNALRHGLSARAVRDPSVAVEVDHLATAICGRPADPVEREQALIIAECEVTLKRVRGARVDVFEQLLPPLDPGVPRSAPSAQASPSHIDQLLRLERYARRALSRRTRAVRSIFTAESDIDSI